MQFRQNQMSTINPYENSLDYARALGERNTRHSLDGNILPNLGTMEDFTLKKAMEVTVLPNMFSRLSEMMEKIKSLDTSYLSQSSGLKYNDIIKDAQAFKLNVSNSSDDMIDINLYNETYKFVMPYINDQLSKNINDAQLKLKKNDDQITENNYPNDNDIAKFVANLNDLGKKTMTVDQIIHNMKLLAPININMRDQEDDVITKFNQQKEIYDQLQSKYMNCNKKNNTTKIRIKLKKQNKSFQKLIPKKSLLSILNHIECMCLSLIDKNIWSSRYKHLSDMISSSFDSFIKIYDKYKRLLDIKSQLEKCITENGILYKNISLCCDDNNNDKEDNEDDELMLKWEQDQLFLENKIKSLKIDEIKAEMGRSWELLSLHIKLIEDYTQSMAKQNNCKICLKDEADQFIDTCGHVLCKKCCDKLSNESNFQMNDEGEYVQSQLCPFCQKNFGKSNIKKIYY